MLQSSLLLLATAYAVSGAVVPWATSNSTGSCTSENVKASLPEITGIMYGDVTVASVYNYSVSAGSNNPAIEGRNFCNVSINYHHANKSDDVSHSSAIHSR